MNWYKIAFPITEKNQYQKNYSDVGHFFDQYEDVNVVVVLWAIDSAGQFYKYEEKSAPEGKNNLRVTHGDLIAKGIFPEDFIATGRYVPDEYITSLNISPYHGMMKKREITNIAEEILDREFGSPKILEY